MPTTEAPRKATEIVPRNRAPADSGGCSEAKLSSADSEPGLRPKEGRTVLPYPTTNTVSDIFDLPHFDDAAIKLFLPFESKIDRA